MNELKGQNILIQHVRFTAWALKQSVLHPRTPLTYYYCTDCETWLHPGASECPSCGKKVGNSPKLVTQSQVPWWGSIIFLIIGVICWCMGAKFDIGGLDEAGRALVYIPLGSIFGLNIRG
jgi:hypothetical protein